MENLEQKLRGGIQLIGFGATETVPGSKFILKVGKYNILIDMGLEYRKGEEKEPIPFENHPNGMKSRDINCLFLTHGHADHVGQMLKLYKAGFGGKIYSTCETADLTKLQLGQTISGPFMYNQWAKGKKFRIGPRQGGWIPFKEILYVNRDLKGIMNLFETTNSQRGVPYNKTIQIAKDGDTDIKATSYEAGHIPGSAQILFEIIHKGRKKKILTAFDLGRKDYDIPIVKSPCTDFPKDIDAVIVESTYGNKIHRPLEESIATLKEAINYTSKEEGQIVVPAFSIMRMQIIKNFLYDFDKLGGLPENMIFCASCPTANGVERIFLKYPDNFDERAKEEYKDPNNCPFNFKRLINHKKMAETLEVIKSGKPAMFLASSGMGSWGRARTILRETISNPKNAVLGTGYFAEGTVMWYIEKGYEKIPFGEEIGDVPLKARYFRMGGLSGHADKVEIVEHMKNIYDPLKDRGKREPLEILIVHGEKENCEAERKNLIENGYLENNVKVMKFGQVYEI